ncbi:MAG: hypothetical protein NVS9B15_06920 [Acidobacteriaceae bacterium]
MPENVVDEIFSRLRATATEFYPQRGVCKTVRLVGHTPKPEHYTYEAVLEFTGGQERVACKVYRSKTKDTPVKLARREFENLTTAFAAVHQDSVGGVPRPLGDHSDLGAVVSEKISGLPLQSLIMKAALLPGYADHQALSRSAAAAGHWLHDFHRSLSGGTVPLDTTKIMSDLETVCASCKVEGLEDNDLRVILTGAKQSLGRGKKTVMSSAALNCFSPLNIAMTEDSIYFCDFSKLTPNTMAFVDVAYFVASVEAREKYPVCNREITSSIQDEFLSAYGIDEVERAIVRVLKMQALLSMFAAGRDGKQTAVRKKVMWANVMKKFIHHAANRTLSNAA